MTQQQSRTIRLAIMNAVHDVAVIVARDEGYFTDEGVDTEFVTAPGMAQVTTDSEILKRQLMSAARHHAQRGRSRSVSHVRMGNHRGRARLGVLRAGAIHGNAHRRDAGWRR